MPCAFMILLFATVAAASTVPAQLDAILKDYGRADAPGASVLVAQGGKVLYRKAFGLANLEERTPITTATNFRLASVTKQFTATAVLLLAERGELSLDDPLTRFFPGFARAAHGVKVRHLLGHTSGLLDYEELIPPGTTVPLKDKDVIELVGKQDRLYFAPGSQFRYSNTGYALLALIVEKVSGRSFAQFAPGDAQDLALRRDHRVQHLPGPLPRQAAHDHHAHEPERQLPRTDGGSHRRCDPRHAVSRQPGRRRARD
jgi:CubicO group peptidase (beta-lactamase class C family)